MALFEINEKSSIPIWLQLKNRFIYLITSGYYKPGDQLPTVRGLAARRRGELQHREQGVHEPRAGRLHPVQAPPGRVRAWTCAGKPGVSISVHGRDRRRSEYLKRCFELGMSLEDIEAAVRAQHERREEPSGTQAEGARPRTRKESEAMGREQARRRVAAASGRRGSRRRASAPSYSDGHAALHGGIRHGDQPQPRLAQRRRRVRRRGVRRSRSVIVLAAAQVGCSAAIGLRRARERRPSSGWLASSSVHIVLEWEKAGGAAPRASSTAWRGRASCSPGPSSSSTRCASTSAWRPRTSAPRRRSRATLCPSTWTPSLFWMVWSAKKRVPWRWRTTASAVSWIAQTAMRKAIGRATVAEVATRRDQLDEELKEAIEEKLSPWGIDHHRRGGPRHRACRRSCRRPWRMEAVAERKKNARMVLAEAEKDISEMLKDASEVYAGDAGRHEAAHRCTWPTRASSSRRHAGRPQRLQRGLRWSRGCGGRGKAAAGEWPGQRRS